MANFCPNCGQPVHADALFCESCGTKLGTPAPETGETARRDPQESTQRDTNARMDIPTPGYSNRINDPDILRAMQKARRASGFFGMFVIPLPLIGFVVYASVTDSMEMADAVKYGLIVSAIFLVFSLFSAVKQRAQKPYEGVVTDKKILNQQTHHLTYSQRRRAGIDDANDRKESYVTYVRTTSGQVKKIVEWTPTYLSAWNYLEVGDRFRYHPQLHFPYEKYDKTHETHLYCVGCLKKNPITADRCSKCGLPLLK